MVYYLHPAEAGTNTVTSNGDGYSFTVSWYRAYPNNRDNKIGYNIYIGTDYNNCLDNGPVYFVDDDITECQIVDLSPREIYYVCVRPVEYSSVTDIGLPIINGLKTYPSSILRSNITTTSLLIPLDDTFGFPETGVIQLGRERIEYFSIDSLNNNLVLNSLNDRGIEDTAVTLHNIDGYDGYGYRSTKISLVVQGESNIFDNIYLCQCTFEYDNYAYVEGDGYKQHTKDILTTDLEQAETIAEQLPPYDGVGYHRTNPVELFNGLCVGSYIGGERYCADGYLGIGTKIRGFSLEQASNANLEQLLDIDGLDVVLLKRQWTGYRCACFTPMRESPLERCNKCYGTGFVVGYDQYYNPRKSSGQIKVRFGPTEEAVKLSENGFESTYETEAWTLTAPVIKNHDILIKIDRFGNEEFRYEVLGVTRNTLINGQQGAQKMRVVRIRKTDPLYQVLAFRNTATMPVKTNLSIESGRDIPPHTHAFVSSENGISQQTSSITAGHNHPIYYDSVKGWYVMEVLGHTHELI